MPSRFLVMLDDVDVSSLLDDGSLRRTLNEPAELDLILRPDPSLLSQVDLGATVALALQEGSQQTRQFTGLVISARLTPEGYAIRCMDPGRELQETTAACIFGAMTPPEMVYCILHATHGSMVKRADIRGPAGRHVAEEDSFRQIRPYIAIAPLGVSSGGISNRVGDFTICRPSDLTDAVKECLDICLQRRPQLVPDPEAQTLAVTNIQEGGFPAALDCARARLSSLCDFLAFAAGSSVACCREQFYQYRMPTTLSSISDPEWTLVCDRTRARRFWFQGQSGFLTSQLSLEEDDDTGLALAQFSWETIQPRNSDNDVSGGQIRQAIHSLRMCRQSMGADDCLTALWNAVEYLVSGLQIPSQFGKEERNCIMEAACEAATNLPGRSPEQGKSDRQRISDLLSKLNDQPLRTKWTSFCLKHGVPVSNDENDLLWRVLRRQRNKQLHGRRSHVERQLVLRGANVIARAVMYATGRTSEATPAS